MHKANSHECLFAFIDFTVRLINGKVTNIIGQKLEKCSERGKRGSKHRPIMSYCYLFPKYFHCLMNSVAIFKRSRSSASFR